MINIRKSANYFRILVVIIPFIWGCNTDTPKPSEEKKHIVRGSKVIQAEEEHLAKAKGQNEE